MPIGGTNCLNFGNPEKPTILWQFTEAIDGMKEACEALDIPITGGNVSFYNETGGRAIYPTPVVGVVGLLEKVEKHVTAPFPQEGLTIIVLGGVLPKQERAWVAFGSSQYAQAILGTLWGTPPALDLPYERRVQECCRKLIEQGLIESAHDLSDGGLVVAIAECAISSGIGAKVDLNFVDDPRLLLFAEDPSRILVTVPEKARPEVESVISEYNVLAAAIGTTGGEALDISWKGQPLFHLTIPTLRSRYESALPQALEAHQLSEA
jgi:phosphoribosylformylglycinamidine synthase